MPTPSVSVVIPTYNGRRVMGPTLASVFAQRGVSYEVIASDDGSTDRTAERLERLARQRPELRVLRGENAGLAENRNRGLRAARGDWVLFLDHDDLLARGALAALLRAAKGHDVVAGSYRLIDEDSRPIGGVCRLSAYRRMARREPVETFTVENRLQLSSFIVSREAALATGGFDGDLTSCEDWDFHIALALNGARFGFVDRVVAGYRRHTGNYTLQFDHMLASQERLYSKYLAHPRTGMFVREMLPHLRLHNRCLLVRWAVLAGDAAARARFLEESLALVPKAFFHFERHVAHHAASISESALAPVSHALAKNDRRSLAVRDAVRARFSGGLARWTRAARSAAFAPAVGARLTEAATLGLRCR